MRSVVWCNSLELDKGNVKKKYRIENEWRDKMEQFITLFSSLVR